MFGENKKILHTGKIIFWQQAIHVFNIFSRKDPDPHLMDPRIRIFEIVWICKKMQIRSTIYMHITSTLNESKK